jgi:hypothetical protein
MSKVSKKGILVYCIAGQRARDAAEKTCRILVLSGGRLGLEATLSLPSSSVWVGLALVPRFLSCVDACRALKNREVR